MEDGEQLMHTGGQGDLLGCAAGEQALVADGEHRMVAHTDQSGPGERRADLPPPAPDGPRAAPGPAISSERREAHQGGHVLATCLTEPWPSAGRWASKGSETVGPTPGTLRKSWTRSRHSGLARRVWSSSLSSSWRACSSQAMCAATLACTAGPACRKRFFSAVSMLTTCWRRSTRAVRA